MQRGQLPRLISTGPWRQDLRWKLPVLAIVWPSILWGSSMNMDENGWTCMNMCEHAWMCLSMKKNILVDANQGKQQTVSHIWKPGTPQEVLLPLPCAPWEIVSSLAARGCHGGGLGGAGLSQWLSHPDLPICYGFYDAIDLQLRARIIYHAFIICVSWISYQYISL